MIDISVALCYTISTKDDHETIYEIACIAIDLRRSKLVIKPPSGWLGSGSDEGRGKLR